MGISVMFYLGSKDGMLSHFMSRPLGQFEAWAKYHEEKWPGIIGSEILALIHDVRERGIVALQANDSVHAACVDRMFLEYYGNFSLHVTGILVKAVDGIVPLRHLLAVTVILTHLSISQEIISLWQYLGEGRPVLRDAKIIPYKVDHYKSRLSYWTLAECTYLQQVLTTLVVTLPESEAKWAIDTSLRAISKAITSQVGLIIDVS